MPAIEAQKAEYRGLSEEALRTSTSASWLRKQANLGKLKIYHAGRKILVKVGDVDRLLEGSAAAC
jgi:hypothetical protein